MVVKHEPKTFAELQKFYTDVYTPLYDRFINSGAAPQELHAEAAACLDHLIDEVQRVPELLSRIQVKVDASPTRKAAYLLTGSHQPALREGLSRSLA